MQTQTSIVIDRPIDQVFALANGDVSRWSAIVIEDTVINDVNNGGEGTTFRIVTEDRGTKLEFVGTVTVYDPPFSSAVRLVGQYFHINTAYAFEDLGHQTRVTQFSEVTGVGFTKIMFSLGGWLMKKGSYDAQLSELKNLKAFVESNV